MLQISNHLRQNFNYPFEKLMNIHTKSNIYITYI